MSQLEVDKIIPQSGTTLTIGDSGDTISLPSGVSLDTLTITGDLTVDTSTLKVDSTNNRVGVKNASPTVELDVTGEAKISGDLTVDTDTLYVDSTNNQVGVGTTSNDTNAKLEVIGNIVGRTTNAVNSNTDFRLMGGAYTGNPATIVTVNGSLGVNEIVYGGGTGAGEPATQHVFNTGTAGTKGSGTERMRIDSSGNVGIGTSSPLGELQIGSSTSSGDTDLYVQSVQTSRPKLRLWSGTVAKLEFSVGSTADIGTTTNHSLKFNTNNTERMNIEGGGTVNVLGALTKGSGSFKIDHPLPEKTDTHHLIHSFVEAPQADNIYRGKVDLVNGTATVNIDTIAGMSEGTFVLLNREIQCFTSNETGWTAVRGSVSGNILTITAQDETCTDTISWLVIGERQDQHMYDTEWTDENGKVIVEPLKPVEEELTLENE